MSTSRVASAAPPTIDPTVAQAAFGVRALPKLNEELCVDDVPLQVPGLFAPPDNPVSRPWQYSSRRCSYSPSSGMRQSPSAAPSRRACWAACCA